MEEKDRGGKSCGKKNVEQAGYELCPSASDMSAEDINVSSAP